MSEESDIKKESMAVTGSSKNDKAPKYLIVDPSKGKKRDIFKFLVKHDLKSGMKFLESFDEGLKEKFAFGHWLVLLISIIIRRFLSFVYTPLKVFGYFVEFLLNFLCQNRGFSGILYNLFHGKLKIPMRGTQDFVSAIGQLDRRIELLKTPAVSEKEDHSICSHIGHKTPDFLQTYIMDLCVMAAKIAYENEKFVQNVIVNHWKMHFEGFYNCWNEYQKRFNTQVFICCDKPKDANLIVVSFRGTEPFNAEDWSTDFDLSWYKVPKVGKLHIGFLEALGLGTRRDITTFQTHLKKEHTGFFHWNDDSEALMMKWIKRSAYYGVSLKLKSLLRKHKHAKFVVTGHSLGGALAIMFPCVLVVQEQKHLLDRLLNVYTFGQPRIGDSQLGTFMESHLNYPQTRYYRVVYCNDVVPRVPFDNKLFGFKHFGTCYYYDSHYFFRMTEEVPNKNFFSLRYYIPMRFNAAWELLRSFIISHIYGPDYLETWACTWFRKLGLVLPGVADHNPADYVNSVRLGRPKIVPASTLESFLHKMF